MGNDQAFIALFTWARELTSNIMRSVFFLLMASACLFALVASECTLDDILRCEREIETALDDCLSIGGIEDIQTCITDILAATDCQKCLCEIISDPFICPPSATL